MHTVIAWGIIKETAKSVNSGTDIDTALLEAGRGASKPVRDAVMDIIQHYHATGKKKEINADSVKAAILKAATEGQR